MLLDRRPFFWVERAGWLGVRRALCMLAMSLMRARRVAPTARAMQWPDAAGVGWFTSNSTQIALHAGSPAIITVFMGVVTSVLGSVLRDIVCNEIPRTFNDHRPCAIFAIAGGWVLAGALALGTPDAVGLVCVALAGAADVLHAAKLVAQERLLHRCCRVRADCACWAVVGLI